MTKKIINILLVVSFVLFFSGCKSLFFQENKPKKINDSNIIADEKEESAPPDIRGFSNLTQGIATDLSSDGQQLVIIKQDASSSEGKSWENNTFNNLLLYNTKEEEAKSIVSSNTNKSFAQLDAEEKGIYYMESNEDLDYQLFWVDIDGNKKVKISSSDHEVNPDFYVAADNTVYYGTKDGKIFRGNQTGSLYEPMDIGVAFSIEQIYYIQSKDLILFSATKDGVQNLYSITSNGEKPTVLIGNIIGRFDISKQEDKLLYMSPIPDSNKKTLWVIKLETMEKSKLTDGFLQRATFCPQGDEVLYLDKTDVNINLQNIWVIPVENGDSKQIASNLKITNEILWHPQLEKIYFSTSQTTSDEVEYNVHSLDF